MSLNFILKKSSGYGCAPEDLENELVQLGLPPGKFPHPKEMNTHLEHSKMISKIYTAAQEAIKDKMLEGIVKEPDFHVHSLERGNNSSEVILTGKLGEKDKAYAFSGPVFHQFCQGIRRNMAHKINKWF